MFLHVCLFACFSARLLACLFEQLCLLMLTALFNGSNRAHRCRRGLVLLLNIIWNHGQADTLHSAGKLRTVETFGADSEYPFCHTGSNHNYQYSQQQSIKSREKETPPSSSPSLSPPKASLTLPNNSNQLSLGQAQAVTG